MNGCDEGIDGLTGNKVTLNTPTINNPIVQGGELRQTVIGQDCAGNPVLAGVTPLASCADLSAAVVTISDVSVTAEHELRIVLSNGSVLTTPLPEPSAQDLAATFLTCSGNPHVPQARLPTCEETEGMIVEAIEALASIADLSISAQNELRLVLSDGTVLAVALPQPTPEAIASTFFTCAGNPHVAGARMPTCAEVDATVVAAITAAGNDLRPTSTNPPPTTEAPELPTTLYGERLALLGRPVGWLNLGGFLVPHYGVIAVCPEEGP